MNVASVEQKQTSYVKTAVNQSVTNTQQAVNIAEKGYVSTVTTRKQDREFF